MQQAASQARPASNTASFAVILASALAPVAAVQPQATKHESRAAFTAIMAENT